MAYRLDDETIQDRLRIAALRETTKPTIAPADVNAARNRFGLTDELTWQNQFRRNDSQLRAPVTAAAAPAAPTAPTAPTAPAAPRSITEDLLNEIMPKLGAVVGATAGPGAASSSGFSSVFNPRQPSAVAPSLSTIASGGTNHEQRWSARTRTQGVGTPGIMRDTRSNGLLTRTSMTPYGGGKTTFGNRKPFELPDEGLKRSPFSFGTAFL